MSYVLGDIGFRHSINLYLRFLGVIYLVAIYSLWTQIHGLVGARGILPVTEFLDMHRQQGGGWLDLPTLLWWFNSDVALSILCVVGLILSAGLMAGLLPMVCATGLWVIYLSLVTVGQVFLAGPWDQLLLECGLLAIMAAPPVLRSRSSTNPEPPRVAVFLLYWLLFRLVFSGGYMKMASGDEAWWNLTALNYYFWTQPLPSWLAWYAHHWSAWFLKMCTLLVLVIELVVPLLVFGARTARTIAFGLLVFLQLAITLSGNFGFFNLLAIALCLPLLDDSWFESDGVVPPTAPRRGVEKYLAPLRLFMTVIIMLVSGMMFLSMLFKTVQWPVPLSTITQAIAPFRSVNQYDEFAVIAKTRPEIIIEGSRDGRDWRAYEFAYKPGDERRTPRVATPHMPRLDWQMREAAQGSYRDNPWVMLFMARLLDGSPDVLGLLENNPFGSEPPRYMRAVLYDFTFASRADHDGKGHWWRRDLRALYSPNIGPGL